MLSQENCKKLQQEVHFPKILMNIDLKKAFGSVYWEFIKEMLEGLYFPSIFVKWTCISSHSFSINIIGGSHVYFEEGMAFRQGDPLSPLFCYLYGISPNTA